MWTVLLGFVKQVRLTLSRLRKFAISASLGRPSTLRRAIARLGFVQADPIRSPARAQDLILRHRVKGYRAGDLEAHYPELDIEEDLLYAYGFMPRFTWKLLHPRAAGKLTSTEKKVLDLVSIHQHIHPRELEQHLGRERELNAWGGYSKSTTRTLQTLHYRGLLRIVGRENGIRLYEAAPQQQEYIEPDERLRQLVLLIAEILAPLSDRSLRATLRHLGHAAPGLSGRKSAVTNLLKTGDLASAEVEEELYVWPATRAIQTTTDQQVRFLAPFDPIVWDRRRFEHFWGWPYRFEAYTPLAKRTMGYYAMPMLWRDQIIGWVNISNREQQLSVEAGYVTNVPADSLFRQEFDSEVERFRKFLAARLTSSLT